MFSDMFFLAESKAINNPVDLAMYNGYTCTFVAYY